MVSINLLGESKHYIDGLLLKQICFYFYMNVIQVREINMIEVNKEDYCNIGLFHTILGKKFSWTSLCG